MEVSTIGLDIAKSVFQVHGVDGSGATVMRRQLRRRQLLGFFAKQPPCLVGMEACAAAQGRIRGRMPTMISLSAMRRSHLGNSGLEHRIELSDWQGLGERNGRL